MTKFELITNYNIETKKKALFKNGLPKKAFLTWNKQQLKNNKTTIYYEDNKLFNVKTGRIINKVYDTRFKTKQLKKSFLKKYNVDNSVFVPKDKNRVEVDIYGANNDNSVYDFTSFTLKNNLLLPAIIKRENIEGDYRLLMVGFSADGTKTKLIDNSFNFNKNFWKEHESTFRVNSTTYLWSVTEEDDVTLKFIKVKFLFTIELYLDYEYYEQSFLDGVNHCVFQPIVNYFNDTIDNAKTDKTKKNYQSKINIINGKQLKNRKVDGLIDIYKYGVPENKLGEICEILQIGFDIEQPFNDNLLFEYRSNKRPLKVFRFVNTRLNHIEENFTNSIKDNIYNSNDSIKLSLKELQTIQESCIKNKELCIFTHNNFGISSIRTLNNNYQLESHYYDTVRDFEYNTNLKYCAIDSIKYPELTRFLNNGTHFNTCIDLKNTEFMRDNQNIPDDMCQIDMSKAYSQYETCRGYNGFMGQITDFRKVNNFNQKGLYLIKDIDLSKCSNQFKKINKIMNWFISKNIYTDNELKLLKDKGGKFKIIGGAFGLTKHFKFEGDMLNKKEIIDIENNEPIKISYYAKYAGMCFMNNEKKSFYMKGDVRYFNTIKKNENTSVYYNEELKEGKITYKKKYSFHKKHITAQITAYQRLIMLEQIENMDIDKIYRVCVDAIYYSDHKFNILKSFAFKKNMTFKNFPATDYLSNILHNDDNLLMDNNFNFPDERKFYKNELFKGAGGNGKTYHNLNDKGLINPVFIGHSWKLTSTQQKDYFKNNENYLMGSVHYRLFNTNGDDEIYKKNCNYIIDEASMLTENEKNLLLKKIDGKIILCGDIGYQLPPIDASAEMTEKGFDNVIELKKNYRFKCDKLKSVIDDVRNNIKNDTLICKKKFTRIKKEDVKDIYNKEDIILVSKGATSNKGKNNYNNYWNEILNIDKFKITNNTRDFKNGEIIYEKPLGKGIEFEKRNGYTIHSVQGATHKKKLFIDMRGINDKRMFYTAISRAQYLNQIFLVE